MPSINKHTATPSVERVREAPIGNVFPGQVLFSDRGDRYSPHKLYSPNELYPYGKLNGAPPTIMEVTNV